jgi:hypothetical protein
LLLQLLQNLKKDIVHPETQINFKNSITDKKNWRLDPTWFLFWLIWPFGALISAIKNFRNPISKTIFILFCLYFGFVFIVSTDLLNGADSARYVQSLVQMHNDPLSFENFRSILYNKETNMVDIYQPFVTWFISLFTGNPKILFAVFAFVFGWFYANNLWIILKRIKHKISFSLFIFLLTFMLINPIWNINGVRMYTAAQIFVYGCLLYFLDGNKKGLIWSASSIIVHFSFLFPLALLFLFFILPKKLPVFFIFFILTSFVTEVNMVQFRKTLNVLPEVFQPRVKSYTNKAYVMRIKNENEKKALHVKIADNALKYTLYTLLIVVFFAFYRNFRQNQILYILFCFSLFIFGWAQLASLIPSGGRFLNIAYSFSIVFLILFFKENIIPYFINYFKILALPLLLFYCIFSIRVGFDYMGLSVIIGNPIFALLINDTTPMIEFVKAIF